jgi:hypothetical protein
MTDDRVKTALIHMDAALTALTLEAEMRRDGDTQWRKIPRMQFTIAEELDRIDAALGPRGSSVLAALASDVREAVVEIVAAMQALGKEVDE